MKTRWFAVRCCCRPQTIYGFLALAEGRPREVVVRDYDGEIHRVELRVNAEMRPPEEAGIGIVLASDGRTEELAIYSDDRGLEFWRTIPGFVEAAGR